MPVGKELPPDRQAYQAVTQTNHTRWWINTIPSRDDERYDAWNMYRHEINKYMKRRAYMVIIKNQIVCLSVHPSHTNRHSQRKDC